MCLLISEYLTKRHSLITENKTFTFYKMLNLRYSKDKLIVTTYFQEIKIENDTEIIEPKSFFIEIKKDKTNYSLIEGGVLHLYTSLKKDCSSFNTDICIKVLAESDDIIAFGINGDVCVSKYKIPKESWNKIYRKMEKVKKKLHLNKK